MSHLFLSIDARQRDSWLVAFPDMMCGHLDRVAQTSGLVWALLPPGQSVQQVVISLRKMLDTRPLILMADVPSEDDALAALSAGAAGYCNGHAAPEVLQQVALAVSNGGVWVGQGLMQRLLSATARLLPELSGENAIWRTVLTAREQEAALLLAKGASNKEIARQLEITERTVKSHVSAMLEKLGARDRLQLSLIINGIEKT